MEESLKSCPFCGSDDLEYVPVRGAGGPERVAQAYCKICNISLPVKIWNTRQPPPKLLEALRPFAKITKIPKGSQFTGEDVNRAEQAIVQVEGK